jgi:hypothetical protein
MGGPVSSAGYLSPPKGIDGRAPFRSAQLGPCRRPANRVTSVLVTHTEPAPCRPHLVLSDSLKMIRETLCVAQAAIGYSPFAMSTRVDEHRDRIGRIINEIDRQRPLGPDGKHGELHTETCGCERPGLHCVHWHDGDNCCRCGDPRDPGVCQGCGSSDCEGCGGPDAVDPRTALEMELADLRYQCRATPGTTTLTVNAQLKASLVARFGSLELAGVHYGIMIQDGYDFPPLTEGPEPGTVFNCRCTMLPPPPDDAEVTAP